MANRNYWTAYTFNSNLVTGAPRTIMLSATYEFQEFQRRLTPVPSMIGTMPRAAVSLRRVDLSP
ncbi:hypothetical protein [Achromobacter aloeverae]